jgi:dTDP-4-dehydrorhamnose reductase
MLGQAVYAYFKPRFEQLKATDKSPGEGDWCEFLDVRDVPAITRMVKEFQPNLILHLAAETNLEFCERNPTVAIATNATATMTLAQLAESCDATLVYISTAGVFDGTKSGLYTEEDRPNPIMVYGATKYLGEELVRALCRRHFIVRAGWMVGGGPGKDHKFVSKILEQIFAGKKTLYAVDDLLGTPTYTYDFAMNLCRLLETEAYGTYHMVCEGTGSRFDVARELVLACNRTDIDVQPVTSEYFKEEYFVPRPRSEMMANANLEQLKINFMRPWKQALREYLGTYYPEYIVADPTAREK